MVVPTYATVAPTLQADQISMLFVPPCHMAISGVLHHGYVVFEVPNPVAVTVIVAQL